MCLGFLILNVHLFEFDYSRFNLKVVQGNQV